MTRPDEPAPGCGRVRALVPPLLIAAIVVLCFVPVLWNDFVLWDDDMILVDNVAYRGLSARHVRWMFTTFLGGQYQPLTWMTFALDYAVWGMRPAGYHLTSLVLHAANGVLAYFLLAALLSRCHADRVRIAGAALVGSLFFAIHPLRVESVAWATARRDVLSGFFYLLAVLAYLRMAAEKEAGSGGHGWLAGSLGCFVLSLLAKGWGVTLPFVLLVLDVYPLRRLRAGRPWSAQRSVLVEKIPYLAIAVAGVGVTLRMLRDFTDVKTLAEHGPAARLEQSAYGLCFYLGKTIDPTGLSPLYLLEPHLDPTAGKYVASIAAVLAITAALVALRRRWPAGFAAWACYGLVVAPVLGLMQTGPQVAADRYSYLASVPVAAVLGAAFYRVSRRSGAVALAALILAALGVATGRQARVWRDTRTLWEHAVRVDPDDYFAELNLGWERQQQGDLDAAERHYTAALRINPRFTFAYNNRGNVRQARGDVDGALADFDAAIAANAAYSSPYLNRGTLRLARGDFRGALADFDRFVALDPADGRGYNNRALARRALGDVRGALADYDEALKRFPPGTPGRETIEQNLVDARAGLAP